MGEPAEFEVCTRASDQGDRWYHVVASELQGSAAVWFANITERKLHEQSLEIEAKHHHLQVELPAGGIGLEVDPVRLTQVIGNLPVEQIFGMFTQVPSAFDKSQGGLGIGFALARGIAELHDGSIWACSEGLGRGSDFPAASASADLGGPPALLHWLYPTSIHVTR